ncbi:MAG: hypothetical protein DMG01_22025 [Acidobacteria bacterium]|nr:MAG: hypothetical protein DMG01_22025 [Acidobacteriota bacterium]
MSGHATRTMQEVDAAPRRGERDPRRSSSGMSTAQYETPRLSPSRHAVEPAWLTVSQLARRWQLGRRTIYKFIDSGILPVWQVGTHLYRIAFADVVRFEARNRRCRK